MALLIAIFSLVPCVSADDWINDSIKKTGHILETVCEGTAPSLDLARRNAIENCKRSALDYLPTTFKAKSVSVETERDTSYHSQIDSDSIVKNLTCRVLNEKHRETEEAFTVWNKCEFDLSKIEITPTSEATTSDHSYLYGIANAEPKGDIKSFGSYQKAERRNITVSTIPKCSTMMVTGALPRIIQCKSNVMPVVLGSGDEELIVRSDGRIPKTIKVMKILESSDEKLQVFLESN